MPDPALMLAAAHTCVREKFGIIPLWWIDGNGRCACRTDCEDRAGKHPIYKGWTTNYARSGADVHTYWDELKPGANIGIVTGQVSGIWLLDIDYRNGGAETLAKFRRDAGDAALLALGTRTIATPGGEHYYFRLPADGTLIHNGSNVLGPGVDVRGEGGFGVTLPSVAGKGPYGPAWDWDTPPPINPAEDYLLTGIRDRPGHTHGAGLTLPEGYKFPTPVRPDMTAISPRLRAAFSEYTEGAERSEHMHYLVRLAREEGHTQAEAAWLHREFALLSGKHADRDDWIARDAATIWKKAEAADDAQYIQVPGLLDLPAPAPAPVPGEEVRQPGEPPPETIFLDPDNAARRVDIARAWYMERPDGKWLWEHIIPAGSSGSFFSPAGLGKTLFVMDGLAAIAAGTTPPGATEAQPPVHVGYLDRENGWFEMRDRWVDMNYDGKELADHMHFYEYPDWAPLDTPLGGRECVTDLLADGVQLAVLDTVGRFLEGKENDADTINNFYKYTITPLRRAGVAVLRIDHTGKDPDKGVRGSSAKAGDLDYAWSMKRAAGRNAFRLVREKDRTGVLPKTIDVARRSEPVLHHICAPHYEAGTDDSSTLIDGVTLQQPACETGTGVSDEILIAQLRALEAPVPLSRRKAMDLLGIGTHRATRIVGRWKEENAS